uniref:Uncharacterized protein n=1 Tax=Tanacetum cinerariifolium TaxID=118510 RepID=A0A6L2MXI6_TANCI|nr:hypothetical protein [Tanacetum cinerariifolium]
MVDEYNALISNQTWALIPRPLNMNVVRSMWLFRHKFNADGLLNSGLLHYFTSNFAKEVLEGAYMKTCNPCQTHVNTEFKLGSDDETLHVSSTPQLTAYTDADWAGCPVTRRSTSSAEAEYCAVANVVAKISWIRNLLRQVHVLHVPSRFQYANIFTKGLPTALFLACRSSLNIRRPPAQTTGKYQSIRFMIKMKYDELVFVRGLYMLILATLEILQVLIGGWDVYTIQGIKEDGYESRARIGC